MCARFEFAWRQAVGLLAASLCLALAACSGGGAAPAPGAPSTPIRSDGWVTLNQNITVEQLPPVRPTAEPAVPKAMSQAEAQSAVPFAFSLPGWAPPGFELQPQAEVMSAAAKGAYSSVSLDWQNAQGDAIQLSISQGEAGAALLGGGGSADTLQVNGQPATLRHQTGLGGDRLTLSWKRGSLAYRLTADAGATTRDDLLRMAASIS